MSSLWSNDDGMLDKSPAALYPTNRAVSADQRWKPKFLGSDGPAETGSAVDKEQEYEKDVPAGWERDLKTGKLRPIKGEVLSFSFDINAEQEDCMVEKGASISLQDGFKGFRKAKINAARNRAAQEKQEDIMRKDPVLMQALRELFIDRCKSYYGVPYAQKYHDAASPLFHSPLFLDCCGLVRQVLRDLKQEFAFETGTSW